MKLKLLFDMLQDAGATTLIMAAAGLLCTVWGVYQFLYPPKKRNRILQVVCSTTPALLGLWFFYRLFSSYSTIAASSVAPTKAEFDLITSHAVILGSLAILCTLIPIGLAVAGLVKNDSSNEILA